MNIEFISIIISKEQSLDFYEALGFVETNREIRPESHDILVWMEGNGLKIKVFVDSTHPARVSNPEAYGLRHLSFKVKSIEALYGKLKNYKPDPIKVSNGKKFFFVRDPDNCPFRFEEA